MYHAVVSSAPARPVLLTWTDRAGERPSAAPAAGGPEADRGPVLRLLEQPEFAERYAAVWVLTTPGAQAATRPLVRELARRVAQVELRVLEVGDPSDYAQLFAALGPVCTELRRAHRAGPLDVLLSAGTPQAQTLWVILVQAGTLAARMLQVIPPRFVPVPHAHAVREVRLDIDGFPEIRALRDEVQRLRAAARARGALGELLGDSPAMRELRARIERLGRADVPVLVLGETGTGKELAARALHRASARHAGPFIAENCGAFAEGVLQSELFGHEAGAFTGATGRRRGLFEQAHGGTLFLDEVAELPPRVQATLLRVLQDGTLRRVGGEARVQVDVRVLAATHRDLKGMVARGEFREDLYYRLCGATLELPPLRARVGDLPLLVDAFLAEASAQSGRPAPELSAAARRALALYPFPGNVRELRAEVQRWTVFCETEVRLKDLAPEIRGAAAEPRADGAGPGSPASSVSASGRPLAEVLGAVEAATVRAALTANQGNLLRTARALGIDRNTLKRKMKSHGLARSGRSS